jgi:hypothetical protein
MILLLLISLLPVDLPRYFPGETIVHVSSWNEGYKGEWATVIRREKGRYRCRLASQAEDESWLLDATWLLTEKEFNRKAWAIVREGQKPQNIMGIPVTTVVPKDLPE